MDKVFAKQVLDLVSNTENLISNYETKIASLEEKVQATQSNVDASKLTKLVEKLASVGLINPLVRKHIETVCIASPSKGVDVIVNELEVKKASLPDKGPALYEVSDAHSQDEVPDADARFNESMDKIRSRLNL